jgi:4-hydroxy-tetrahydrodipicolinate reductase
MKIALIGYGKMGRTIEALGKKQGHDFPLIIDEHNRDDLHAGNMDMIDAAIEFTIPAAAPENIKACLRLGIPVVSGTTGWNAQFPEIEKCCKQNQGSLFHASNFSIGVNILFAMNRQLARIMDRFPAYTVSMEEVHHIHKLDAPSGTAISLAEQILEESHRLQNWKLQEGEPSRGSNRAKPHQHQSEVLPIRAIRQGEVKGRHTLIYESEVDSISLIHEAKSRDAFAAGALLAAEFLQGKKGVYGMRDLLKL